MNVIVWSCSIVIIGLIVVLSRDGNRESSLFTDRYMLKMQQDINAPSEYTQRHAEPDPTPS
ncbi:hypothetical protein BDV25DRAFT_117207 [Aspergillus avenaceus]|uniref:Uncharacterized protein n=1 Tax=Aspergillus avenaceus TaxID=36643 RepID=A0A5N6TV18_ASPAV|nr:hypothetical protein BDV25DRAFT_117207 [Aspergillus avenaceus]